MNTNAYRSVHTDVTEHKIHTFGSQDNINKNICSSMKCDPLLVLELSSLFFVFENLNYIKNLKIFLTTTNYQNSRRKRISSKTAS